MTADEPDGLAKFSELAGPLMPAPAAGESYRVRFRRMTPSRSGDHYVAPPKRRRRTTVQRHLIVWATCLLETFWVVWLFLPSHHPKFNRGIVINAANGFVLVSVLVMVVLQMINVWSLGHATFRARYPIPVEPPDDLRVAFVTTIVPSREPFADVIPTLEAAQRIEYASPIDIWLLDEGNDPLIIAHCRKMGINHFSRRDVPDYNQPRGRFRTLSKAGNLNAFMAEHGDIYDVVMGVDPDHRPLPNFAQRILGYFRDARVAFVVGPQVYANVAANLVVKGAESQQFPFHSVIQPAANSYGTAMLVGTNYAIRTSALGHVGGFADSITEDMATGLNFHASRDPVSGHRHKSVYTPDVLASGEGPASWGSYFTQQYRWSAGTFVVLRSNMRDCMRRMSVGQLFHYFLIMSFYPSQALAWLLAAVAGGMNAWLGADGIFVNPQWWLLLSVDTLSLQLCLYFWNRRFNVSPYDDPESFGMIGMAMTVLSCPIYAMAFINTILGRRPKFNVTPKGSAAGNDQWSSFRYHIGFGLLLGVTFAVAWWRGHTSPATYMWTAMSLTICCAPIVLWRLHLINTRVQGVKEPEDLGSEEAVILPVDRKAAS